MNEQTRQRRQDEWEVDLIDDAPVATPFPTERPGWWPRFLAWILF